MEEIFKTQKGDKKISIFYLGFLILFISLALYIHYQETDYVAILLMGIIGALPLFLLIVSHRWLRIIIRNEELIVHFFFNVYKTDVKNITKIRKGETMWSGFHKYGTTVKGMTVFAKFSNDLYINPKYQELFFGKMKSINPQIIIEKV
jgi:hypothetical protein